MQFKLLKKFFVTTLFIISIISTGANAEVIDNDTNLGEPYGNVCFEFNYLPRGLNGDSRLSSDELNNPNNYTVGCYRWYKLEYHHRLRYVAPYLDDLAFTDTAARYSSSINFFGDYLMGTSLGTIDQFNSPSGYIMCGVQHIFIVGYVSIGCYPTNGQTGADAILLDYYEH